MNADREPTRRHGLQLGDPALHAFWQERHLATLTTLTRAGRPHTVPVAPVLDPERGDLRILTSRWSQKIRNVIAAADGPAWASVCQMDGRWWCTLDGRARVVSEPNAVADAEADHATRFRVPRPNRDRVVLVITIDSAKGSLP